MIKIEGHEFEEPNFKFDGTDAEWSATHLPWVRLAADYIASNEIKFAHAMAKRIEDETVVELFEGLMRAKRHLNALSDLVELALVRASLEVGRLGCKPGNPPPDCPLN